MHQIKKYISIFLLAIGIGLLLWLFLPYLASPVYDFVPGKQFSGQYIYNPYQQMQPSWKVANFHAHCKSWGGVTDGKNNSLQSFVDAYKYLGYDYFSVSNYQKIDNVKQADSNLFFIPTYEHGVNVKKRHYLILGADRVFWSDFFFWQTLHHKQFMINSLRGNCDFLTINHPKFCNGFQPSDMAKLSNYDAIEVLNHYRTSIAHWDTALSSGYYAVLLGNDDMHHLDSMDEIATNFTVLNVDTIGNRYEIINTLRRGQHFGVKVHRERSTETYLFKKERIANLVLPDSIAVSGDTIHCAFTQTVGTINFIGQGGVLKQESLNTQSAQYVMDTADTYIRIEVYDKDSNLLLFNPIVRSQSKVIVNESRYVVNAKKTLLKHGVEILIALIIIGLLFRKRLKQLREKFGQWVQKPYRKQLLIIVLCSLLLRIVLACIMEFTNDELYYLSFAKFPDWSYFDHPPMVGWLICLTSWGLLFRQTFFVRLSALVLCTITSFIVFQIGTRLKNERAGLITALLYNISPYVLIVSGTFIIPDAGLMFFWMLSLLLAIDIFIVQKSATWGKFLLLGLTIGLACLSKYTALMLWGGIGLWILLKNRSWLKNSKLYLAILVTAVCIIPIIYWNYCHHFISFTYHGGRVAVQGFNFSCFVNEIFGEVLYNHPIIYILMWIVLVIHIKNKKIGQYGLFYFTALPMIVLFLFFSLFRYTLPHWSAPAFTTLLIPLAVFVEEQMQTDHSKIKIWLKMAVGAVPVVAVLFVIQFYTGIFIPAGAPIRDHSIEVATNQQAAKAFINYAHQQEKEGKMAVKAPIMAPRWEYAANFDNYICPQDGRRILTMGPLYRTHEYASISQNRNGFQIGMDMWYIEDSYLHNSPIHYRTCFDSIVMMDTLQIYRNNQAIRQFYVYKMQNLRRILPYVY